jgi:hypothetical protein
MKTETQQPEDLVSLYRRAFAEYGARALWNKRELETPNPPDALVVARALRVEATVKRGGWPNRSNGPAVPLSRIQIHSDDTLLKSGPMLAPNNNNSGTPAKAGAHRGHRSRPSPGRRM